MPPARTIPPETIERMLQAVEPSWKLRDATRESRGHTSVYHVDVATETGPRAMVLKASPDDEPHGIRTESRLLERLADRTDIPVPSVVAAVDDHESFPTPFFLMESMPGTALPYQETRHLSDRILRRLGTRTGEHLGRLHSLDGPEAFGVVRLGTESGDRAQPSGSDEQIRVSNGVGSWPDFLFASVEPELDRLARSRFDDLEPAVRPWVHDRVEAAPGTGSPVIGRIDHGVHNLLMRRDEGRIEALIDWGFTLAVTPGYDLRTVEYVLSGAVLAPLDDATDRRRLVREALEEGYRRTARYPTDELAAAGDLYELMAVVRAMNHLDDGVAKVPDGSEDAVARGLRSTVGRLID